MQVFETTLAGCLRIAPRVFVDERGAFFESFNQGAFAEKTGLSIRFVQDNISVSKAGVLRGLHYQYTQPQGKLVSVISGAVLDIAVDLRVNSKTFGNYYSCLLSAENREQLWIPVGFAHGFLALAPETTVLYKTTDFYNPKDEHCILWSDPSLKIDWLGHANHTFAESQLIISKKDQLGKSFHEVPKFT